MKTPFYAFAMLILVSAVPSAHAADFLSAKEKSAILGDIDTMAGDSWDESDHEYSFLNVKCESETAKCTVYYRSRFQDADKFDGGGSDARNLKLHPWGKLESCVLKNVHNYNELSDATGDFDRMDKCIGG